MRRVPRQWWVTAFWIAVTICAVGWPTQTLYVLVVLGAAYALAKGFRLFRAERRSATARGRRG